eukprot:Skav205045  [mRNA]  locus=scaffold2506:181439:186157:+ [translate_table: standard]
MSLCLMVDGLGVGSFLRSVAQQTWAQRSGAVKAAGMGRAPALCAGANHPGFSIVEGNELWIHQPLPQSPPLHEKRAEMLEDGGSGRPGWKAPASNETLLLESVTWQVLRRLRVLTTPELLEEDCEPWRSCESSVDQHVINS